MLRTKPDVVIATPGRLIDHLHNTAGFGLEALEILVLDEADRLLELGFSDELAEASCSRCLARFGLVWFGFGLVWFWCGGERRFDADV